MSHKELDEDIKMGDDLRRKVERMTTFQRRYCEYRGRGLTQTDSAMKAGSKSQGKQALGRVGYNIEATVAGAKDFIAYLQAVKAKAACVSELEVIEGLRDIARNAIANGKYGEANKSYELLGSYIGMFGKAKENLNRQEDRANQVVSNNISAFKDEGESLEERKTKLGVLLQEVTNKGPND